MTRDEAISLLVRGSGTHFDPNIVELFIKHLPEFEAEIAAQGLPQQLIATNVDESFKLIEVDLAQSRERGYHIAYDQIKNAHREVYALYEIARTFGSSLDMDETLSILVDKVAHVIPFDTCAVYIYDERLGYATAVHVAGKNATLIKSKSVVPGEGVTGFAMANRSPANQLHPGVEFVNESERAIKYRSMAALPLVKDNSLLGALSVYSMELDQYTDDHIRLLETVTKLASDAIANSIHHAEAKSNALTDLITGLPNARYLAVRFEEEVARARRTGRPFQLIMLDLDDFKIVNDTFGHKIGDKMLREVARIIHGQLREYDFLARYAGDEFVAIVQELVASQVNELRMRIESAVLQYSLQVRGDRRARVGISIGTAAYGLDGESLDQLLVAADQEMYRMKSEHKLGHLSDDPATPPKKRPDPDEPDITSNSVN
jgi:diguanylate cyclase (GGDEF)-like protein